MSEEKEYDLNNKTILKSSCGLIDILNNMYKSGVSCMAPVRKCHEEYIQKILECFDVVIKYSTINLKYLDTASLKLLSDLTSGYCILQETLIEEKGIYLDGKESNTVYDWTGMIKENNKRCILDKVNKDIGIITKWLFSDKIKKVRATEYK